MNGCNGLEAGINDAEVKIVCDFDQRIAEEVPLIVQRVNAFILIVCMLLGRFFASRSSPPLLPDLHYSCSAMNGKCSCFEVEPAPAVRERRHSHISGSDRESPLVMTGGEIESGLWWTSLFL